MFLYTPKSAIKASMEMKPVDSSQIEAVGYDEATKTLGIRFRGTSKTFTGPAGITRTKSPPATYHYQNVTPEEHKALMGAKSVGSHFYAHIKPFPKRYPYKRQ